MTNKHFLVKHILLRLACLSREKLSSVNASVLLLHIIALSSFCIWSVSKESYFILLCSYFLSQMLSVSLPVVPKTCK